MKNLYILLIISIFSIQYSFAQFEGYSSSQWEKQLDIEESFYKLIDKTLELKGTITGEHGVGLHKKSYLLKEHPDNIPVMKTIKRSLDPNNIMNPGKIFDLN